LGLIDNILHENYRSVVAAQNMMVAIERQDSAELSYINNYLDSFNSMKQIRADEGLEGAKLYYYQTAFKNFERVKEECRRLLDINQNEMIKLRDMAALTAKKAIIYMAATSAVIVLAGLVFALRMSNRIFKPIFERRSGI